MGSRPSAGWARPSSQKKSEPTHWWTPDDTKACAKREDRIRFSGARNPEITEDGFYDFPGDACRICIKKIVKALELLGLDFSEASIR
jgi:hypothetical protein